MDATDRLILNRLQAGFPLSERPYAEVAAELSLSEETLIDRLQRLLDDGVLTRFGPMYDAQKMGGGLTLAAMEVPTDRFEEVAARVNAFPEVAHNYARDHALNMWFVLATEWPGRISEVLAEIEATTGLAVVDLPKLDEYFLELRLEA